MAGAEGNVFRGFDGKFISLKFITPEIEKLLTGKNGPLAQTLLRLAVKVETEAKKLVNGPMVAVDTGRLRSSITHELVEEPSGRLFGKTIAAYVGSPVEYAIHIIRGREPGTQPPSDKLQAWAQRKGLAVNGYVIARAIGERGQPPKDFLTAALKTVQGAE